MRELRSIGLATMSVAMGLSLLFGQVRAAELPSSGQRKMSLVERPASSASPFATRVFLGINGPGGHVAVQWSPRWGAEARFLLGSADSDAGKLTAQSYGLRGFMIFGRAQRLQFYAGPEFAILSAHNANRDYRTDGHAVGAFAGLEYQMTDRWSLGVDAGPYMFDIGVNGSGTRTKSVDFVGNAFVRLRIL